MNTIGKILVVLNLVMAVVVVVFFGLDFATRTNWKSAYDQLKGEMTVAGLNSDAAGGTLAKLNNDVATRQGKIDELQKRLEEQEITHKVQIGNIELQRDVAEAKIEAADVLSKKAQAENVRLKDEVKLLVGTISKREEYIADLQKDNKKLRTTAINQELALKSTQDRNESLLTQVQELSKELQRQKVGGTDTSPVKDPNQPNPPKVFVKGKIDTVDTNGLVKISVGSDQGVEKNTTLEVYRLSPRPEYLGMIRIVEADHHAAIGRLIRTSSSGTRGPLREGDTVASSLSPP